MTWGLGNTELCQDTETNKSTNVLKKCMKAILAVMNPAYVNTNQDHVQLPVGLLAQLVEHCTDVIEVMDSIL